MTMQAAGRRPEPTSPQEAPRSFAGAVPPTTARRVTPSQAVLGRPFLVLLPILVLLVPSLALALFRAPTHEAEARLLVGGFDVEAQAVPGFVEASRTLAETYSRLVPTRAVAERVAQVLDLDLEAVDGRIDASPVPESSIVRVIGKGDDPDEAIRFAAAAAEALEDYVSESGGDTEREELLDEFRLASVALNDAVARQDALDTAYQSRVDAGVATGADLEVLTAAQADVDRARLEAETLADAYRESRGRSGRAGNLDLVAPAASSGDDSRSALQLAIAGPILLGAVAGVALATIVANRKGLPAHAAVPGRS